MHRWTRPRQTRTGLRACAGTLAVLLLAGCAPGPELSDVGKAAPDQAAAAQEGAPHFAPGPDDVVDPDGLPALGKWMIDPDGTVAHWLGATYGGKHIREPINVVLVDTGADTAGEARTRLAAAMAAAGYPSREGHSGGYRGWIGGQTYPQLPDEPDHAYSNRFYIFDNNHGRVFGPAPVAEGYLFIAAFSRERIAPLARLKHQYASFNRARDDVTQELAARSRYRITGFVDMDNAIVDDPAVTTGDHDGRAVKLRMD